MAMMSENPETNDHRLIMHIRHTMRPDAVNTAFLAAINRYDRLIINKFMH